MKRLALLPLLLLADCGHSPPTRFFTLDPMPPAGQSTAVTTLAPVQLDAVHIPSTLDRPEMVSQPAANRLKVSDQDRWGAPLGDMMRRTLAQDLLARLPSGTLVLPDAPKPPGVRGLVVNVLALQADPSGRVYLQGSWSLLAGKPTLPVLTRTIQLSATAAPGASGQAAATSQLLAQLADQIAPLLAQG